MIVITCRQRNKSSGWIGQRTGLELALLALFLLTLTVATTFLIVIATRGKGLCGKYHYGKYRGRQTYRQTDRQTDRPDQGRQTDRPDRQTD